VQGRRKTGAVGYLKIHFSNKTPQQLNTTLTFMLGNTRGIIHPTKTPTKYEQKALGAPTGASKEESDVKNAIHNPINNPINGPIRRAAMKLEQKEGGHRPAGGDGVRRPHPL
jgi:hypothetical protein